MPGQVAAITGPDLYENHMIQRGVRRWIHLATTPTLSFRTTLASRLRNVASQRQTLSHTHGTPRRNMARADWPSCIVCYIPAHMETWIHGCMDIQTNKHITYNTHPSINPSTHQSITHPYIHYITTQCMTAHRSTLQYNILHCITVQHITVRYFHALLQANK